MTQALSELRGPVPHEALRLRMVALHGREDALLDAARFQRLLRQANDAEVADVRKVGDDEYEVSAHRAGSVPSIAAPAASAAAAPATEAAGVAAEPAVESGSRENGQRLGLRFRRGSRGPARLGEVPLVGVVQIDAPAPAPAPAPTTEPATEPAESETTVAGTKPARKPTRARAPRKKAAASPAAAARSEPAEPSTTTPRRPRSRTKKKAE
jgi:hypothetical protein